RPPDWQPAPLHHPRGPPRPPERPAAARYAARRERPAGGPLPVDLHADLRDSRRLPDLLRIHHRLPHLRLHALPRPPSHTAHQVGKAVAGAAHAPPLPGPPFRIRRLVPTVGRHLPHPA